MELIKIFNDIFETNLSFEIHGRRMGDPDFLVASNSKANELLGWHPELGIERMMLDHKNFLLQGN